MSLAFNALCSWCSSFVDDVDNSGACADCSKQLTATQPRFPMLCSWCGDHVRDTEVENSSAMCAACLERLYPEGEV
jgi:hypothetical protein